jgi:ACS family tartrate transporter-like MFS transporter
MLSSPPLPPIPSERAAVLRRVTWRLIPFAFICYVVAYVDRVNIGFAQRALVHDLGLSATEYGVGAGLFFLGYCVFEIPSNLMLERVGARLWIARIMIVWGIVSMATMFIWDVWSFMIARVVLGIAEAGFFPGMVLYLTYWIPSEHRGRANALFMTAAPICVLIGAPISEALLKLDGVGGLHGWQWLFVVEGLPAVILGVLALWVLTDKPEDATWLAPDDREWLSRTMVTERESRATTGHGSILAGMRSGRVWILSVVYLMNASVTYGIFLWLPRMLQDAAGPGARSISLYTSIPMAAAVVSMVLIGRHSDRTGEPQFHVAACAITGALGLFMAIAAPGNLWVLVLSMTICQIGQRSVMSVFWTIPPLLLGGSAAAAGIALINAIGNIGGFAGPSVMGCACPMRKRRRPRSATRGQSPVGPDRQRARDDSQPFAAERAPRLEQRAAWIGNLEDCDARVTGEREERERTIGFLLFSRSPVKRPGPRTSHGPLKAARCQEPHPALGGGCPSKESLALQSPPT